MFAIQTTAVHPIPAVREQLADEFNIFCVTSVIFRPTELFELLSTVMLLKPCIFCSKTCFFCSIKIKILFVKIIVVVQMARKTPMLQVQECFKNSSAYYIYRIKELKYNGLLLVQFSYCDVHVGMLFFFKGY